MKKLILSLFVILTLFTITACKKEEKKEEQKEEEKEKQKEKEEEKYEYGLNMTELECRTNSEHLDHFLFFYKKIL